MNPIFKPLAKIAAKLTPRYKRVLYFDPSSLYSRITPYLDVHKRIQRRTGLFDKMFPKVDGMCSCGCGKPLTGKQKRWASKPCNTFATDIYFIICGYQGTVERLMLRYLGHKCSCDEIFGLEMDHIVPVKFGGGGCWLNNYQWLCNKCHRLKTNKDFGFKS